MSKARKAYICQTSFNHDLCDDNAGAIDIYGSKAALKAATKCWEECGIYELEVRVIEKPKRKTRKNSRKMRKARRK